MIYRLSVLALAALAGCSPQSAENHADNALRAIYSAEWTWRQEQLPDDEDSQKPIQDHLPSVTAAAEETRLNYWQNVLKNLDDVDRNALSPQEHLNYDVYRPEIEALIAGQRFRDYEMPANSDTTFWTNLGYTARRTFKTPASPRILR